jgi:hypothetical protein
MSVPFTKEAITRALQAMTEYDRLPHELQTELHERLTTTCMLRHQAGLTEVEALSVSLQALKGEIQEATAHHFRTQVLPPRAAQRPIGVLSLALMHWASFMLLCMGAGPSLEERAKQLGEHKWSLWTEVAFTLADLCLNFWPLAAAIGLVLLSIVLLQLRTTVLIFKRLKLVAWILVVAFFVLNFTVIVGMIQPFSGNP